MDEMLARVNQLYPNCGYVQIRPYDAEAWQNKEYDRIEKEAREMLRL